MRINRSMLSTVAAACLTFPISGCTNSAHQAAIAAHHMPGGKPIPYINHQKIKEDDRRPMDVGMVVASGGLNDHGMNRLAYAALQHVESDYGVMGSILQANAPQDYVPDLTEFARKRTALVIAVGSRLHRAVEQVSREFPQTKFLILDDRVTDRPNVASAYLGTDQAGYVAGALAGWMEQTSGVARMNPANVVGVVVNASTDSASRYVAGFTHGMRMADPRGTVVVRYLQHPGLSKVSAELAQNTIWQGADIVYAVGQNTQGAIMAAEHAHVYAIGAYEDMNRLAPGTVLVSTLAKIASPIHETLFHLIDNQFRAGVTTWNLHNQGVGVTAPSPVVPAQVTSRVRKLENSIADGDVVRTSFSSELGWSNQQSAQVR